jgi:hypothetical protein
MLTYWNLTACLDGENAVNPAEVLRDYDNFIAEDSVIEEIMGN